MRVRVSIIGVGSFASVAAGLMPTTASAQNDACHPSYIGWCVPINRGDVDCLGGTGNGPNYVGQVRVVGPDLFGLDGIGCDNPDRPASAGVVQAPGTLVAL
jgi:hypothetical protein